jgi:RimJ/RimL family protein N-acetyltransferase/predicted N-acetyltransferase YhbS
MDWSIRALSRDEISRVWEIDRQEVINAVYHVQDGQLILMPEQYDMRSWPAGEAEQYTPLLLDCLDQGGIIWGAFAGEALIGVAVLESRFILWEKDTLQLKFLHVSHNWRSAGLGKALFELCAQQARQWGAEKLYISATPSQHTIDFYLRRGCTLASEVDPDLFTLEPEDIHLEYSLSIPTLNTRQLILRPLAPCDAAVLHHIYQEEGVLRYFPSPIPPPLERIKYWIANQQKHWKEYGCGNWAVLPIGEFEIVGWGGLQYLPETGETEVGFLLNRPWWGRGFATEIARASLQFGFLNQALERIIALVFEQNFASRRVLEKCGLRYQDRKVYFGVELLRYWINSSEFFA